MSHFANVVDGIVQEVIVAEQDFVDTVMVYERAGTWVQTSFNTNGGVHYDPETGLPSADQSKALRKNFAGVGYSYDEDRDAFIPPKPFFSWLLNEETCHWEPPIAYPDDGLYYTWNETTQSWDEVTT